MSRLTRRTALGALAGLASVAPALAQDSRQGVLVIASPWSRAAGQGGTGAGYLTLRNTGAEADRLVSASTPAAGAVELHTHINDNGVMRMRPTTAIELPPGQTVTLQPGGLHLMLVGLTGPLRQGSQVPLTLVFEKAGTVLVQLAVQSAGARGPAAAHGH